MIVNIAEQQDTIARLLDERRQLKEDFSQRLHEINR
jgi:hypothetical protein